MEILKDKKMLVGGLAVIGGIALVAFLLKPKAPRRNSDGFFNLSGTPITPPLTPITPPVQLQPISLINQLEACNLPNNFTKQVMQRAGSAIKNFCGRYYRVVGMNIKGNKQFEYRLTVNIPNTPFYKGSFINQNGEPIVSSYQKISASAYENAFINGQECQVNTIPIIPPFVRK